MCCRYNLAVHHACSRCSRILVSYLQAVSTSDVTSKLVGNNAEVIQLYRYPGLAPAAATTLLHKVCPVVLTSDRQKQQPTNKPCGSRHAALYCPADCHVLKVSWAILRQAAKAGTCTRSYAFLSDVMSSDFCTANLLLQIQHKVTDAITSIDGELCFNIGVAAPLDANEADRMAW